MVAPEQPKFLCLDIETPRDSTVPREVAAWRADTGASGHWQAAQGTGALSAMLESLAQGAALVLGHNIVRHDLPALMRTLPPGALFELPVVDTLELSPVAFPRNPYHALVKDYKLVSETRNDPLRDARLAFRLWQDEFAAFEELEEQGPEEVACQHFLFSRDEKSGTGRFFMYLRGKPAPAEAEVRQIVAKLAQGKACPVGLERVLDEGLADAAAARALAYVLAWLRVAGGDSVLPPWVRLQYPLVAQFIRWMRETPCADPACPYCSEWLDPRRELHRVFGLPGFRAQPANAQGGSLQEDIVRAAWGRVPLLAILPTGGGKSLCYQLPALSRYWQSGALTVIVSPLQSLMKDQVDNLVQRGLFSAATLNGLLTPPERKEALERIRHGGAGILLVSPEQFRNPGFTEAIRYREIAAWVFDEAHCLSRWGHDFRPDYLYVSRFISEHYPEPRAPIQCYTATARQEVIEDLRQHFRERLGQELAVFNGGQRRDNLYYEVRPVARGEKMALMQALLESELKGEGAAGGAVVFVARRKSAEEYGAFLRDMGWPCAHFHAGLEAGHKKDIQEAFIKGELQVIVATNAFGMGVDKPDVRLVIHAEIPGSLENYLQEAGRAGRDQGAARCVLLFDEEDIEGQFRLAAMSRLSRQDIAGILRALRRLAGRNRSDEVVVTAGEILALDDGETDIEPGQRDSDTKVVTALSWLERARLLTRDENHTRVYPASLKVGSLDEAGKRLSGLSEEERRPYLDLLRAIAQASADEGISTDRLMLELGKPPQDCIRMLNVLERRGILSNDLALTMLLRHGVADASADRLKRLGLVETALLEILPELAPDAAGEQWQEMALRPLTQALHDQFCESRVATHGAPLARLRERGGEVRGSGHDFHPPEDSSQSHDRSEELKGVLPETLLTVLRSLARPFGEGRDQSRRDLFELRLLQREFLRVKVLKTWPHVREVARLRQTVGAALLRHLLGKLPAYSRGVDLRVECSMGELADVLRHDLELGPSYVHEGKDETEDISAGLLYLHDNGVLVLDRGKSVFRSAMTLRLKPEDKARKFTATDFKELEAHYDERTLQVHVMHEYARLGLERLSDALAFVVAYFTLPKLDFIRRYFAGRKEMLERATTAESWQRIVGELSLAQRPLVTARGDGNRLILAGPGSGKTRVIVHRVAFLLRVLREPARGIVVLCYNRGAAAEIRARLRQLVGTDAFGVTVLTYHALAMRLTGTSLAGSNEDLPDFDALLDQALALLKGQGAGEALEQDELRERLLSGYRHILVDEYQDIDERQYQLVSALAGRTSRDAEAKLTLLAVGDDDQNIYAFRATSNEFISRFQEDWQADIAWLVENYRSSKAIIAAANAVIAPNRDRLKSYHPIRINHGREKEAPGGRWTRLDPLACGRVQVLLVPAEPLAQAETAMSELARLKSLDKESDWSEFAVLARTHAMLEPVQAWCELEGVPYTLASGDASGQPRLTRTREGRALFLRLAEKRTGRVSGPGLKRWLKARFPGQANPWLDMLDRFAAELSDTWGKASLPRSLALEALVEFGLDARRSQQGRIALLTAHGAKGREFRHVLVLDGSDWSGSPDERRLYYVAMTRAGETLTLCQALIRPNSFTPALSGGWLLRSPFSSALTPRPELARRYFSAGMKDVFVDYAGRQLPKAPIHAALENLEVGDPLVIVASERGKDIRTLSGLTVGRLAKNRSLPNGSILHATVESLVWRCRDDVKAPEWQQPLKVAGWWVVLPRLMIALDGAP